MASIDKEFEIVGTLSEDCTTIEITHHKMLRRLISGLRGEKLRVRFSKLRLKRSDAQNRYIHGVVVPHVRIFFLDTEGIQYTHDEAYVWLRTGLLGQKPEIKEVGGVQVIVMTGKRFSKMTTKEFEEAMEIIRQEMAVRGCVIPEPRQHNFLEEFLDE